MKTIHLTVRTMAIIQLILGVIHCSFTPIVMKDITGDIRMSFLCMFLLSGLFCIYIGLVLLKDARVLKRSAKPNLSMINLTFGFILCFGILASVTMPDNPFSWLTLGLAVCGTFIIFGIQIMKKHEKN